MDNPEIKPSIICQKKFKYFYYENNFLTTFYITNPLTCLEIEKNC